MTSEFAYDAGDFITTLTTPYGVTRFTKVDPNKTSTTRALETIYPDGDRDRVEYNQHTPLAGSVPVQDIPEGMATTKDFIEVRNTFYWSAYATAYPDYHKAKIYHWLHGLAHMPDLNTTAGILESVKEPLEGRVWFDYAGVGNSIFVGSTNKPAHVGRVLDDGSTQLYTYEYNGFGNVTKMIDPVGRTFSYTYAENGIDLLESRQIPRRSERIAFQNDLQRAASALDHHRCCGSDDHLHVQPPWAGANPNECEERNDHLHLRRQWPFDFGGWATAWIVHCLHLRFS